MANEHMKTTNVTSSQGNVNPNHNEILHTQQDYYYQTSKKWKTTEVCEDVVKLELLYTASKNVDLCSHHGKQFSRSSKS